VTHRSEQLAETDALAVVMVVHWSTHDVVQTFSHSVLAVVVHEVSHSL
jgi:hypothetical protein